MALSYLQDAQIDVGFLTGQTLMKQDMRSMKSSFDSNSNNNSNSNRNRNRNRNNSNSNNSSSTCTSTIANNNASQAMFPAIDAAAGLSILTQQQLLAAQAALISRIPVSLHATLASPSLYSPHSIFNGWTPQPASSPPASLHHSPGSVSPTISTRSASRRNNSTSTSTSTSTSKSNNNGSVANNEKKKKAQKRKNSQNVEAAQSPPSEENPSGPPVSPPVVNPETARDSREKIFTCGICKRSFGYKHVLQNHERTHTGEKPFECGECHKKFTRDHHLKTHMRLHTGEKPYICVHCDRKFVQVANLRRHLRVHTGERPYNCEVCSSRFSDSNQLKAHSLIHKGEKPFECEQCQVRFRRRHHLLNHRCDPNSAAQNSVEPEMNSSPMYNNNVNHNMEEAVNVDDDDDDSNEEESENAFTVQKIITPITGPLPHQPSTSAASTSRLMPLNLPAIPTNLPEQTEPEDLSMSTGMHRSPNSNDDSLTITPDNDELHREDNQERDVPEFRRPRGKYTRQHPKGAFSKTRNLS